MARRPGDRHPEEIEGPLTIVGLPLLGAIACLLVVYVGGVMQATTGIGVGIVSSPVLLQADPDFIPAAVVAAVLPLSFTVAWKDRAHVDRAGVTVAIIGRLPGIVLGVAVIAVVSDTTLGYLVAATVLLGVVASLTAKRFEPSMPALAAAGCASGFTGTAVGVGGPPIALTYQHSDPVTMRATISVFFSIGSVLSIIALAAVGEFGRRQLELTALLVPAVLLGLFTARRYKHRLVGSGVRPVVLGLSAFSAIALLIRTVF